MELSGGEAQKIALARALYKDAPVIVQQGTHAELLKEKDGKYLEMWNAQARYYVRQAPAGVSAGTSL